MCKTRLDRIKQVVKDFYPIADCGLFFSRNLIGDQMETIYDEDGIQIDICYYYSYLEIFGLSDDEQKTMKHFYLELELEDKNE